MGMAPSFYHYLPVPLDDQMKEGGPRRCWLGLMVGLVMAGLIIALSIFMVRYYSEACQNGLELERQCHNVTQLLKKQLIQAKEESLAAETRADTCDQTVVSHRHPREGWGPTGPQERGSWESVPGPPQ
uniref:bone marrow stromal antigen 2 n=1 Tax=Ictidomys tridecemlineatus TaxID=43179 RepID=UPI00038C5655|nr:bone marrow stromal antigen 2 [Ictidomys tridecemlineatus]